MNDDLQGQLQAYCVRAFPSRQGVQVNGLASVSAGWESDVYSFDVEHGPPAARQREELILRVYPGDDAHAKSAREFRGMRQLHKTGYPVPRVLLLERENSPFGRPFVIMERIEGQMLWPILFNAPERRQQELLTQFCELFVRLHRLDWRPFVDDVARYELGGPTVFVDQWLRRVRGTLERFPLSNSLRILEWLEARRDQVPCLRPSPVHWDYHPGNVLLRDDGSAVVIDWTQVEVSDPRFDLAWTLLLVSSYEGAEWRDRILEEYERLAGARVEQMEWFEVCACGKRVFSVAMSLLAGAEKLGMRPGAAEMMKQQMWALERVYDLLVERTGIRMVEVERLLDRRS